MMFYGCVAPISDVSLIHCYKICYCLPVSGGIITDYVNWQYPSQRPTFTHTHDVKQTQSLPKIHSNKKLYKNTKNAYISFSSQRAQWNVQTI